MICSCCGYEIKDKVHPIKNGEKFVCDSCWNNPDLFFAEKLDNDSRLKLLAEIANYKRNQASSIEIDVIRFHQKGIEMYIGKMKAKELLQLFEIDEFKEEELEGYQRELYEERTSELVEYLSKCPLAIMPAILVSLRGANFISQNGDFGTLSIPRKKGAIWMIDGQHRIGGFDKVRERFIFTKSIDPSQFPDLMNYEFPVVFFDSASAAAKIRNAQILPETQFSSEDVERTVFFVVNKTQRGISPSLKDALLYRIKTSGIEGLPIIRKEGWRIRAARIAIVLNKDENSPLAERINISGRRGTGKPIQLNSFVSSLKILFSDEGFSGLGDDEKIGFLKAYWEALKELFPEAFEMKTFKGHMLLKALGVYSLNWIGKDLFHICLKRDYNFADKVILKALLSPLESFDWNVQTSPLSSFGGVKGASRAHGLLLGIINQQIKIKDEAQTLQGYLNNG
jgi:DNA sulfur modification protein DndB